MARTKSTPHQSPSFVSNEDSVTIRHEINIPAVLQAPLQTQAVEEIPITLDWTSVTIIQATAEKRQRELREALRITQVALADRSSVTNEQLTWAKQIGERERALQEAENETLSADSEGFLREHDEAVTKRTSLTVDELAAFLDQDRESDVLSEVSNITDLDPELEGRAERRKLATGLAATIWAAAFGFAAMIWDAHARGARF